MCGIFIYIWIIYGVNVDTQICWYIYTYIHIYSTHMLIYIYIYIPHMEHIVSRFWSLFLVPDRWRPKSCQPFELPRAEQLDPQKAWAETPNPHGFVLSLLGIFQYVCVYILGMIYIYNMFWPKWSNLDLAKSGTSNGELSMRGPKLKEKTTWQENQNTVDLQCLQFFVSCSLW